MPAIRYFTVTEEREVQVSATNSVDAIALALRVLSGTRKPEDQLDIQSAPRQVQLSVREVRF